MTLRHDFYHPAYWPTWLGFCVLRSVELLPYRAQRGAASLLGKLLRFSSLPSVSLARRNLEMCLPDLTSAERVELLDRHCQSVAMSLCEIANSWWSSAARITSLAHFDGISHLRAALNQGTGALLLSGHFTTLEIASRMLGSVVKLNVLYRPPRNALLAHATFTSIQRYGNPIAHDDVRAMLRALKRNEVLCYAPGYGHADRSSIPIRFLGMANTTSTASSRLARMAHAPVLTLAPERLPGNDGYRISVAPLTPFPTDDADADARCFTRWLERQIARVPDQYFWAYPNLAAPLASVKT